MAQEEVMLTVEGLKRLEKELEELKFVKRHEVAERIKQAIEFGDISENSEYDDAKNEQAFIEGRIATLEKKLRNAKLIEETDGDPETVTFGSRVKLIDMEFGDEMEYYLVGSMEADPAQSKISNESPVGKAILGHRKGDTVDVEVPAGKLKYQILDISR